MYLAEAAGRERIHPNSPARLHEGWAPQVAEPAGRGYEGRAPQVAETAGWCCERFRPGVCRVMKARHQKQQQPQAGVMKPGYNIPPKSQAGVMKARCVIGVARFGVARFNWQSLRKAACNPGAHTPTPPCSRLSVTTTMPNRSTRQGQTQTETITNRCPLAVPSQLSDPCAARAGALEFWVVGTTQGGGETASQHMMMMMTTTLIMMKKRGSGVCSNVPRNTGSADDQVDQAASFHALI